MVGVCYQTKKTKKISLLTCLLQNGLTEKDIVNFNTICLSNINKIKSNSKVDIKQNTDKSECRNMFTKLLKKYGDITWQQGKNQRR